MLIFYDYDDKEHDRDDHHDDDNQNDDDNDDDDDDDNRDDDDHHDDDDKDQVGALKSIAFNVSSCLGCPGSPVEGGIKVIFILIIVIFTIPTLSLSFLSFHHCHFTIVIPSLSLSSLSFHHCHRHLCHFRPRCCCEVEVGSARRWPGLTTRTPWSTSPASR